jgi:signal transduction histidine kinase
MLLTGVTAGEVLGFSRAFALLTDEKDGELVGALGIGAQTSAEAKSSWRAFEETATAVSPEQRLRDLLDDVEAYARRIDDGAVEDSAISVALKGQRWGLRGKDAIGRCLSTGEVVIVQAHEDDPVRELLAAVSREDRGSAFACVPLKTTRDVGCLIVDDRFLPTERTLDAARLPGLQSYSEHISIYVENYFLRRRRQGQTYHELSHQLRRPVTNAYGKARQMLSDPSVSGRSKLTALRITTDLSRAITVIRNVKLFSELTDSGQLQANPKPVSRDQFIAFLLRTAMDYAISVERHRQLTFDVDEGSFGSRNYDELSYDLFLFPQAVYNVLDNALKYSIKGSIVRIYGSNEQATSPLLVANRGIVLTQQDSTSVGIRGWRSPDAAATNAEGSGIGLWLTRHIMQAHGGSLKVVPTDEHGITVMELALPPRCKQ